MALSIGKMIYTQLTQPTFFFGVHYFKTNPYHHLCNQVLLPIQENLKVTPTQQRNCQEEGIQHVIVIANYKEVPVSGFGRET